MRYPHSSHAVIGTIKHHVPRWVRRALLLGGVVLSLAMVGDPASARTWAPFLPDTPSGTPTSTGRTGLTLALHTAGAWHRSIDGWSEGATEALSLLALGLGLIGAGRVLGQKRHETRAISAAPAASGETEVLRPHDSRVMSIAQRAAR